MIRVRCSDSSTHTAAAQPVKRIREELKRVEKRRVGERRVE